MTRRFYHGNQPRDPTYSFDFRDHADDYINSNTNGGANNDPISICPFTDVSATIRKHAAPTLASNEDKTIHGVTLAYPSNINHRNKVDRIEIGSGSVGDTPLWNTPQNITWELLFQFNELNYHHPFLAIRDPSDDKWGMWKRHGGKLFYSKRAYNDFSYTGGDQLLSTGGDVFTGNMVASDLLFENNNWVHWVITMDKDTKKMKYFIRGAGYAPPRYNNLQSNTIDFSSNPERFLGGGGAIYLFDYKQYRQNVSNGHFGEVTVKYLNMWVGGSVLTDLEVENLYFSRFHGASWDTRYYSGPVISSDTTNIFGNYFDTSFNFVRPVATDLFYDTNDNTSYQLFSDISHLDIFI